MVGIGIEHFVYGNCLFEVQKKKFLEYLKNNNKIKKSGYIYVFIYVR